MAKDEIKVSRSSDTTWPMNLQETTVSDGKVKGTGRSFLGRTKDADSRAVSNYVEARDGYDRRMAEGATSDSGGWYDGPSSASHPSNSPRSAKNKPLKKKRPCGGGTSGWYDGSSPGGGTGKPGCSLGINDLGYECDPRPEPIPPAVAWFMLICMILIAIGMIVGIYLLASLF